MHPRLNLAAENGLFDTTDDVFVLPSIYQFFDEFLDEFLIRRCFEELSPEFLTIGGRGGCSGGFQCAFLSTNRIGGVRRW